MKGQGRITQVGDKRESAMISQPPAAHETRVAEHLEAGFVAGKVPQPWHDFPLAQVKKLPMKGEPSPLIRV